MLWGSGAIILLSYIAGFVLPHDAPLGLGVFTHGIQEMMNLMWWGILVGMLLDLCNQGVLMVGAKLYKRGASLGQVFAFLIASPWNLLPLTVIIGVLMGWEGMVIFLIAYLVIAFATGLVVEALERAGRVRPNPNREDLPADFHVWREAKAGLRSTCYDMAFATDVARSHGTAKGGTSAAAF